MKSSNSVEEKKTNKTENEILRQDIERVFMYARCHSAQIHPDREDEMVSIINLKQAVLKALKLVNEKQ